jgi:hypothetical protein
MIVEGEKTRSSLKNCGVQVVLDSPKVDREAELVWRRECELSARMQGGRRVVKDIGGSRE